MLSEERLCDIYAFHRRRLVSTVARFFEASTATAFNEDLVQDVFLRLFKSRATVTILENRSFEWAFLLACLRQRVIDLYRYRQRHPTVSLEDLLTSNENDLEGNRVLFRFLSIEYDLDGVYDALQALAACSPKQRQAVARAVAGYKGEPGRDRERLSAARKVLREAVA